MALKKTSFSNGDHPPSNQTGKNFGFIPSNNKNLFSKEYYRCECGYEVTQKELKSHFDQCFYMSSKFQGLFFCLNHEISECNGDLQKLKNLKTVIGSFID